MNHAPIFDQEVFEKYGVEVAAENQTASTSTINEDEISFGKWTTGGDFDAFPERLQWAREGEGTVTIIEKMTDEQVGRLSKNEFMVLMGTCRRKITNAERMCWDERTRQDKLKLMAES